MIFFNKKLLFISIFLIILISIFIYSYTKDSSSDFILTNDLYISSTPENVIEEISQIIVHVAGEVINPGLVTLAENSRIDNAISAAGGVTELADVSKINLAYVLQDGQKIYIPSIYDEEELVYIEVSAGDNIVIPTESPQSNLINLNTATQAELQTLPGVGESTAKKIIDYRTKNGKFKQIEDIMNVSGIGEAKFNAIKDNICI